MSRNAVIKASSYVLVHGPDFVIHNGTTQTTERIVNPKSEYLTALPGHIRSYERAVSYPPNQVYIGNLVPEDLRSYGTPWYDKEVSGAQRYGKLGEIMPQDEFLGLVQICDVFDLVFLDKEFVGPVKEKLSAHPLMDETLLARLKVGVEHSEIVKFVEEEHAEPLYHNGNLVGYVKRAHDVDVSLTAHVLLENLVYKATGVLTLLHLMNNTGIAKGDVDYVIDCSEEACGDMNQRGGGNFAKAQAEIAGLVNATGSDTRGFCAAPVHSLIEAAALVKSGTYKNVVVFAGGTTAKLGMNGKDHVKKGLPILEDVMGGFAVLISENDGVNPEINSDIVGRHSVGTGSSPQAVISSLVTEPLERAGLKITDIGKYAAEMQNPDVTKPAGAGDVPEANYKMIAALGVKQGALERARIADFVKEHGMPGWAPTQGHIPSGVPYVGFAREDILSGKIEKAMIIGKGSLFLGRMTNLFDGVSIVLQKNSGKDALSQTHTAHMAVSLPIIGIAAEGSELGMEVVYEGAALAERKGYKAIVIEGEDAHKKMEAMLASGEIQGAVTMHYPFPIGVSTVGRVITPGKGKELYLATTTGTSSTDRVEGMVKNAIYGIIAAKASGVAEPTVGIANVDGARQAEMALLTLKERGYDIRFAESQRSDGGVIMRGNDLLTASSDIMVMDPLTGNLMMKLFSAYTTGGSYESTGYGYGPGIGEGYDKLVLIISRASGAPVIAGAVEYASQLVKNDWKSIAREEFAKANKAGLKEVLESAKCRAKSGDAGLPKAPDTPEEVTPPAKEIVTAEIHGIEVMDIEDAAVYLWKEGIYAETGMGCTGPVVLVNEANESKSREILSKAGFIK
jgi:hypothetical protein